MVVLLPSTPPAKAASTNGLLLPRSATLYPSTTCVPRSIYSHAMPSCPLLLRQSLLNSQAPALHNLSHTLSARATSLRTAVAVAADTLNSSLPSEQLTAQQTSNKYYFVVANAKFMLDEEEHLQELMSERIRLYGERNKELDFWLVIEPKFLDKFPNIAKRLRRPAVALVSTNGPWITFMKLRLDRVLCESFEADSLEEALASKPADLEFGKPENWVAPYPKYESGWWEPFLPPGPQKSTV